MEERDKRTAHSDKLNIGADHLGKIEVGKRGISIDLLLDLSEKLNVSIDFLIKGNEDRSPQAQILISKMRELLDQFEDIEGISPDGSAFDEKSRITSP